GAGDGWVEAVGGGGGAGRPGAGWWVASSWALAASARGAETRRHNTAPKTNRGTRCIAGPPATGREEGESVASLRTGGVEGFSDPSIGPRARPWISGRRGRGAAAPSGLPGRALSRPGAAPASCPASPP